MIFQQMKPGTSVHQIITESIQIGGKMIYL